MQMISVSLSMNACLSSAQLLNRPFVFHCRMDVCFWAGFGLIPGFIYVF